MWMNKLEVETMSIDDLYNNFKIVEQKVKKSVVASSGAQNLAFMTTPSTSSTNDANTASLQVSQVSAASPSVNTASPQVCTASVSDNTVYAFMVENPNGSNVLHQDLEQIHEDDLEAMDLKWQLSLLSVRAKKYYQKTGKKIFINGNDIAGYDKSKVECYNCHKLGHFARECRASRSKEDQFRNQDNTRKQGNKEDTSKAMLAIDGVGFDWSDMAEEQVQTNMALMAFSDSEVYTDKTCSKTCLNNYETLKKQYDDLLAKQLQTKFEAATYKRGLDTVEAQLVTYRKNEVLFSEEVVVLKREVGIKQYEINTLKTEFEKLKQEKDAFDFKIEKFDKASKDLDQLLESQITDKSKKGLGYSAVPPPHPLIYNRPNKLDLSYSGLDEFKEPEFKGYGPENSKKESNVVKESDNSKENSDKSLVKEQESQVKSSFVEGCGSNTSKKVSKVEPKKVRENNDAPIIEDWVSDDEEQDESMTKPEKKTVIPTAAKIEKPVKKSVRYAEMYRSQRPRGNQRNWNGQKSNQLESLDSIFNRLQKIVSRLAILGVIIAQEDLNLKFLSSLPPEWNTHVVVWMNKPEIETMSIDDLYNNFKIVEQKIKKTVGTSSGGQNLAFMTAPNSSSTNDANTAYSQVSAASPSVNTASPQVCTASVSDNTVYAFMVENPNGSNVLHQDLEQIHEDDLEAMDLKWQLSLLSVRAKKYYQKTGKKIFINGNDIAGYDKSKVECYNCHKLGHFARECRASRSKEDQFRNQDNTRKQGNKEDTSKAMLAIDGVGFDWSDMAEEQVQTNMALMAFSDSEVYTDKTCSKTCLNNYETLKKQYDDLLAKQHQTKFEAATYKRGLDTVEAQLVTYRKNEVLFSEEVDVLKREVGIKQYEINMLKTEFEKVKQEKDGIEFKIEKFDKASKDLDQLLESQITNKSKKGLGYSAVPPPHPLIYNRPNKLDLSYSGLDEFKEPEFKGYGPENSKKESNVVCEKESNNSKENSDKSLVKEQESQVKSTFVEGYDEKQDESKTKPKKKIVIPTAAKIEDQLKSQLGMQRCIDHKFLEGIREIGMVRSPIN
ncbi:ribonuclease H-like domain-containing protein [Tanacetum coccineum]